MTKSDLIDILCETQKMPKSRAELLVSVIFDSMEAALREGRRIEIRGFGSFEIRTYRAYEGRNPRTGSTVDVKPKRLPFFKVGKELKERVNKGATTARRVGPKSMATAKVTTPAAATSTSGVPQPAPREATGPVDASDAESSAAQPKTNRATA